MEKDYLIRIYNFIDKLVTSSDIGIIEWYHAKNHAITIFCEYYNLQRSDSSIIPEHVAAAAFYAALNTSSNGRYSENRKLADEAVPKAMKKLGYSFEGIKTIVNEIKKEKLQKLPIVIPQDDNKNPIVMIFDEDYDAYVSLLPSEYSKYCETHTGKKRKLEDAVLQVNYL